MATFNFYLKSTKNPDEETLINLHILWNGNKIKYSTGEKLKPKFWENQRVKSTKAYPGHPELNERLNNIRIEARKSLMEFQNRMDYSPSKQELIDELNESIRSESKTSNLFDFIDKLIVEKTIEYKRKHRKVDRNSIVMTYRQTKNVLLEYSKKKNKRVDFDTINLDFYYSFLEFCEDVKEYSLNNIGKHVKTIRSFMNRGFERGIHRNLAYKNRDFKVTREDIDNIYLNDEEIEAIANLDLPPDTDIDYSRDLFLIGCHTGLRYSDFSQLNKRNIKGNRIIVKTSKTGKEVVIPIHPTVEKILKKYNYDPPYVNDVVINKQIKVFCKTIDILDVDEYITKTKSGKTDTLTYKKYELYCSHTARRSFATNYYKKGAPTKVIMDITGHTTETNFFTYIKVTPDESASILETFMK